MYFSQGNLQYTKSTQVWSFMENQYDVLGTTNQNVGNDHANQDVVSYFGWGTSGCNLRGTTSSYYYQPYNTNESSGNYYGPQGNYSLTGDYANGDWGVYNAISNGGNVANQWKTMSMDEWKYVFTQRNEASSKYGHGSVNGVNGMIVLPDAWELPTGLTFTAGNSDWANVYTVEQWAEMEAGGAVFLPAAGWRTGTTILKVGEWCCYWSTTYIYNNRSLAINSLIESNSLDTEDHSIRHRGMSVRLVCPVE